MNNISITNIENAINNKVRSREKLNKGRISRNVEENKFDRDTVPKRLQPHIDRLVREKKDEKKRQDIATRHRLGLEEKRENNAARPPVWIGKDTNYIVERYEDLYERGNAKLHIDKERTVPEVRNSETFGFKARTTHIPQSRLFTRLYNQSASMRRDGKKQREEIDRAS